MAEAQDKLNDVVLSIQASAKEPLLPTPVQGGAIAPLLPTPVQTGTKSPLLPTPAAMLPTPERNPNPSVKPKKEKKKKSSVPKSKAETVVIEPFIPGKDYSFLTEPVTQAHPRHDDAAASQPEGEWTQHDEIILLGQNNQYASFLYAKKYIRKRLEELNAPQVTIK